MLMPNYPMIGLLSHLAGANEIKYVCQYHTTMLYLAPKKLETTTATTSRSKYWCRIIILTTRL